MLPLVCALGSHDVMKRILRLVLRIVSGTPQERSKARYQLGLLLRGIDLKYDAVEYLGLDKGRSQAHDNSGGPDLNVVLRTLTISPADAVLDIGCGKGGAMITLAQWPFSRIDGIEISRHLIEIAQRNLRRLNCARGTITLCDAAEFKHFDPYTFLYMYHPTTDVVLRNVLHNLLSSLSRSPREVTIIYRNPVYHDLVVACGFQQIKQFDHVRHLVRVYRNATATA